MMTCLVGIYRFPEPRVASRELVIRVWGLFDFAPTMGNCHLLKLTEMLYRYHHCMRESLIQFVTTNFVVEYRYNGTIARSTVLGSDKLEYR